MFMFMVSLMHVALTPTFFLDDTGYGSCSMKEEKEDDDRIILHIVDMNMND